MNKIFSKMASKLGIDSSSPFEAVFLNRNVDNTQPHGTNPIKKFTVEFLGNQTADNSCSQRDLGFMGHIQGKWYAIFGDTLWCACGVTNPKDNPEGFHGMVRNSVSAATDNALIVHDLNLNNDTPVPHQLQFVPYNPRWGEDNTFGFGGTSLVETNYDTAEGALFYLVVSRNLLKPRRRTF